ncbi:cache domain-containing protein, partial [Arenibaculum sp.]|uniref:cache domain-containing protein n=1 Tax=Arenibaculum sp. TaxID=2865862 RepID=UPI002E148015|nr:cache domain-containing protein [Arenibaculum sp.]
MEETVEMSGNHAYRPAPLRATLAWLCLTAALAGAGFASIAIWSDYVQTRRQAEQHLEAAAALVEEHALGAIGTADQLTARAAQFVRGKAPGDLWGDWGQWAELRTMADSLPYVVSLLVVDRDGVVMLGTHAFPAGKTDVSDRVYFQALREGDETHVGRTILGRSAGRYVFTVSRRLDAPDGTFGGAIAVTLDTGYFLEAYRKSGLGPSAVLTVVRNDGTVIVRHPFSAAALERSYADDPLFATHLPAGPAGVFAGASLDARERLIAYRASDRLPLVGVASLDLGEVYRPWLRRTTWTVGLALAALVAV